MVHTIHDVVRMPDREPRRQHGFLAAAHSRVSFCPPPAETEVASVRRTAWRLI